MISLESAHSIAKLYLIGYFIFFIASYLNQENNKSNLIIVSLALVNCLCSLYLTEHASFTTYYLWSSLQQLVVILFCVFIHLYFTIKHEKTTLTVYFFYIVISISFLLIHRIRVVIYDSDEPILWLINAHSVFTLSLYFMSICVFSYGCKIEWKLQFRRLFL
jgi:hypothetical protein